MNTPYPWLATTPRRPSWLKRLLLGHAGMSMTMALILVGALFLAASTWVILNYIVQPPMMFQPTKKMPSLTARKLEHRIRVKNFSQQARRPMLVQKLASTAPGRVALPPIPPVKLVTDGARALPSVVSPIGAGIGSVGIGGMGIGTAGAAGLEGFSEVAFFGTKLSTRAIVVLIDNSPSMRTRGVVAAALEEMSNMVCRFHPDTRFNVIAYRDGAGPFKPDMAFATHEGKQAFATWMHWLTTTLAGEYCGNQKGTAGTTPMAALVAALAMNPDTIVILRDDQPPYADRDTSGAEARMEHGKALCAAVSEHQKSAPQRVTVNTFLFRPAAVRNDKQYKECTDLLKRLASMTGGRHREIAAEQKNKEPD